MNTPLHIKIRVAIVLALGIVLFATIGWSFVSPSEPAGPLLVSMRSDTVQTVLFVVLLVVVSTVPSLAVAGRWGREIAPLAVPAGLGAWSIMTPDMGRLLLNHNGIDSRSELFYRFAGESFLWFCVVLLAFLSAFLITGFLSVHRKEQDGSDDNLQSQTDQATRKHPSKPSAWWLRSSAGLLLACVIAALLVLMFNQSGTTKLLLDDQRVVTAAGMPMHGQIIFAVFAAFFLAALASQQLFNVSIWSLLPAPLVVSIFAYISTAQDTTLAALDNIAPTFIPSAARIAVILPLQYIGLGTLAVMGGYWFSIRARRIRLHAG